MTTIETVKDESRQFCRTGVGEYGRLHRRGAGGVTLTWEGGTRRLHWCAEHAADAQAYRPGSDQERAEAAASAPRQCCDATGNEPCRTYCPEVLDGRWYGDL